MKKMYPAKATATGGRNRHVKSDNGVLDMQVRAPQKIKILNDHNTQMLNG